MMISLRSFGPATAGGIASPASETSSVIEQRRDWWSLRPVEQQQPPRVVNTSWSEHPIDHFILAKLESEGIAPASLAGPRTLVRRLSLVLTGLPPTPEEVDEFCRQAELEPDEAYTRLVDRLLDSKHFGERWARHWMDVVRFAETYGFEWNFEIRDAWRYRDYLIRAFNADLPYDQFVREHLAGDLLPNPRVHPQLGINESVIGTAFYRFGETGHDDCVVFPAIRFDVVDNQIDTLSKAFQATTVSCARCHDHKLDAISNADYYALAGILESSRPVVHTIDPADRFVSLIAKLDEKKNEIRGELSDVWLADLGRCEDQLLAAMASLEAADDVASEEPVEGASERPPILQQVAQADLPWHSPAFLLRQMAELPASDPATIQSTWGDLHADFRRELRGIEEFNASHFKPWADFRETSPPDWHANGLGLRDGMPSPSGEFAVAAEGEQVVTMVLPAGRYTHLHSDKLNGALRSPWVSKEHNYVSVRLLAGGIGMARAVVESCLLNEYSGGTPHYFVETTQKWQQFSTGRDAPHRFYLELVTKAENARWPERSGNEKTKDKALQLSPRSWFGVVRAVTHDCNESPREELDHIARLFDDETPRTTADVAHLYRSVLHQVVEAFRDRRTTDADVRWINWALDSGLLRNTAEEGTRLAELVQQYRSEEANISPPQVVCGMADQGPGADVPLLQGGDPATPGPTVPRRYLQVLATEPIDSDPTGSGRLEMSEAIACPENPLTARVMVNRIWQHLFGKGIVGTPDDFGRMGVPPTHPALLDYLASEFVENGWSVKQLIRRIVTSRTFQQSSRAVPAADQLDAANRYLHHYPVYRLDAEAIRDSILTVSGRLVQTLFGPSIQPHRTEEKLHRKLASGPIDGNGRRSIYIKVTRMEGDGFLALFDFPEPLATRGRRDRTNVPAQALAMLNDRFLVDQTQYWSSRLVERDDVSPESRIHWMYQKALGRPPAAPELQRMTAMVRRLAELHGVPWDGVPRNQAVWKDACHAMLNLKELIYVW